MIAILQRVSSASVEVGAETVGRIGAGCLVLLGVERGDGEQAAAVLAQRVATCRMFAAGAKKYQVTGVVIELTDDMVQAMARTKTRSFLL